MRGNTFGKLFSVTTFGESHGVAIGVVIDGVPGGLSFNYDELQAELDRRRPGRLKGSTSRNEPDQAEILSGIFDGKTLGTPITVIVRNQNQKSSDYDSLKTEFRPGHADQTTLLKYGVRDHRGGGRSSGRETLSRVIAGYFASLIIPKIETDSFALNIGQIKSKAGARNTYGLNGVDSEEVENYLLTLKKQGESVGGKVRCIVKNVPEGLGEPCFDKLKAELAKAMMSIGAVMAFEIGKGVDFADLAGSQATTQIENFGGMAGGISTGEDIVFTITVRAPSTVGDKAKEGRHDPCIIPRIYPVIESMAKIVIADHYLRQKAYGDG